MRDLLLRTVLPWVVTAAALYYAFRGIEFRLVWDHLGDIEPLWAVASIVCTALSYFLRAARWRLLFPERPIEYVSGLKVLVLGFFMNNVLPARAGEFVRAHMGARVTGEKRTLVLATVASERLLDGLTISLMFVVLGFGQTESRLMHNMLLVAGMFVFVGLGVLTTLAFRVWIFGIFKRVGERFGHRLTLYALSRFEMFINGLTPLAQWRRLPGIVVWSIMVWGIELVAYGSIARAFGVPLDLTGSVLFLVAVNFAALIPAAPGGLGVIEAVGRAMLVSVGIPTELALTIVMTQHLIQYVVVSAPGALVMLTWKREIEQIEQERGRDERDDIDAPC